jgi:hypothetical protein
MRGVAMCCSSIDTDQSAIRLRTVKLWLKRVQAATRRMPSADQAAEARQAVLAQHAEIAKLRRVVAEEQRVVAHHADIVVGRDHAEHLGGDGLAAVHEAHPEHLAGGEVVERRIGGAVYHRPFGAEDELLELLDVELDAHREAELAKRAIDPIVEQIPGGPGARHGIDGRGKILGHDQLLW